MPCWEVNTLSVEFSGRSEELLRAMGAEKVRAGIWRLGSIKIDTNQGTITGRSQELINQVKRKYSEAAVMKAAKVNRWSVTKKGQRKFQAIKY